MMWFVSNFLLISVFRTDAVSIHAKLTHWLIFSSRKGKFIHMDYAKQLATFY